MPVIAEERVVLSESPAVSVPAPSVYYPVANYRPVFVPTVVIPWGHRHRDRHFWR